MQLHPVDQDVPAARTASYDGVAEIWFDDRDAAAAMSTSDHYCIVVAADEETFLDRAKMVFLYAHEDSII